MRLQCGRGLRIRPTTDIIRETLFNILGPRVAGAVFCDLYAGCGSVGIEALSRGAARCVFVDSRRECLRTIEANLTHTGLSGQARVIPGRLPRCYGQVARENGPFDIVFVDPPYGHRRLDELARRLVVEGEGLTEAALVIIQRSEHDSAGMLPEPDRTRTFGETVVDLYEVGGGMSEHE